MARAIQPLPPAVPGFDVLSRGWSTRCTGAVPSQVFGRLWRTLLYLFSRYSTVALECHTLAYRCSQCTSDCVRHLAHSAIYLAEEHYPSLSCSCFASQHFYWIELVRRMDYAGYSRPRTVSVHFHSRVCPEVPLPCGAPDCSPDRLVVGGIPYHTPIACCRNLCVLGLAFTSSPESAALFASCRRGSHDSRYGCRGLHFAALVSIRQAVAGGQRAAILVGARDR